MICITLSKKFAIYTDWTTDEESRIFYVGKGNQKRVNTFDRNEIHERISLKHGCNRFIVHETDDENEALSVEIALIAEFKTYAHGGDDHWGANLTLGGDGTSGRVWTDEQRVVHGQKMKERQLPSDFGRKISEIQKSLWQNPSHRAKMKLARVGCYIVNDDLRKRLSELAKLRWEDPNKRSAYIDSNRARWDDDTRKQHSDAAKRRWSNPEQRSQASDAAKERWQDPEQLRQKCETMQRLWDDPEYRAKLSKPRKCKACGELGHMAKTCKTSITG